MRPLTCSRGISSLRLVTVEMIWPKTRARPPGSLGPWRRSKPARSLSIFDKLGMRMRDRWRSIIEKRWRRKQKVRHAKRSSRKQDPT